MNILEIASLENISQNIVYGPFFFKLTYTSKTAHHKEHFDKITNVTQKYAYK